jgi:WD40 repeat protein
MLDTILAGGHADNSLKVVATNTAHAVESALGHCSPITCLALSPEGSTLVTGSGDATVILWGIHGSSSMVSEGSSTMSDPSLVAAAAAASASSTSDGAEASSSLADFRRRHVEGPLHVLRGHVDELVCCCVNADLDLVVSSSHTKGVLLHSITHGRFLRQLPIGRADMIALSPEGIIVVFDKASRVLQAFTVNGVQIAVKVLPSWEGDISSIVISKDGLHAVIGTSCGTTPISSGKKLQNAKSVSNSDNMHPSSEHFPQWTVDSPCHSCGERMGMHSSHCSFSHSQWNKQPVDQIGLQKLESEMVCTSSGIQQSAGSGQFQRSELGLVRNISGVGQSDELQRSLSGTSLSQSEELAGMRRSASGGLNSDYMPPIDPQPAIILVELYTLKVSGLHDTYNLACLKS